jgi:hypothetical protein
MPQPIVFYFVVVIAMDLLLIKGTIVDEGRGILFYGTDSNVGSSPLSASAGIYSCDATTVCAPVSVLGVLQPRHA